MTVDKKVSVIVPAYNVKNTIAQCLDSLICQTYDAKEILVVDDGSTDGTAEICDMYVKNNKCVKVFHQNNKGVSFARNVALDAATGQYIVFVDSDDTVGEQYIQELMQWSEYDFVTAGYRWQAPDLQWHLRQFPEENITIQRLKAFPSKYIGKYFFGSPWATLMKKDLIDKGNIRFDVNIKSGEDTLFIFQYLHYVSTIKFLPVCSYNYFFSDNSLSNYKHKDYWKWKIKVEREISSFFHPFDDKEKRSLLNRSFDVLKDLLRDYSQQMSNQELYNLFNDCFFEDCIAYKKVSGKFLDHILIFSMEHKNYTLYKYMVNIKSFFKRVKGYLKRRLFRYWRYFNDTDIS